KAELTKVSIPGQIVIGRHRLSHKREVAVIPRKLPGLDHYTAHGGSIPAQKLCSRVNDDICPMLQRAKHIRWRQCRINNQRDAMFGRKLAKTLQTHKQPLTD